jgi:hypothetical protein
LAEPEFTHHGAALAKVKAVLPSRHFLRAASVLHPDEGTVGIGHTKRFTKCPHRKRLMDLTAAAVKFVYIGQMRAARYQAETQQGRQENYPPDATIPLRRV